MRLLIITKRQSTLELLVKLSFIRKIYKSKGKERTRYLIEVPKRLIEAYEVDFSKEYRITIEKYEIRNKREK